MKPLLRGCLPLCLATAYLLVVLQPASAQFQVGNPPPGFAVGNPPGNFVGNPPGNGFQQRGNNFQGTQPNNPFQPAFTPVNPDPAVTNAANGVSAGMIVGGIFLLILGLGLTGGVIYMGMLGQKTTYEGDSGRRRKKRRDYDD